MKKHQKLVRHLTYTVQPWQQRLSAPVPEDLRGLARSLRCGSEVVVEGAIHMQRAPSGIGQGLLLVSVLGIDHAVTTILGGLAAWLAACTSTCIRACTCA